MALRSLLTLFTGAKDEDIALDYSLRLAESMGAHLDCLHVSPNPEQVLNAYIDVPSGMLNQFVEDIEKRNASKCAAAEKIFCEHAAGFQIPVVEHANPSKQVSASFQALHGYADKILADHGKTCDLIILPRDVGKNGPDFAAASDHALFETGVPTLYVPPVKDSEHIRTICVAWNGSREAARALHYSLPLLAKANSIYIVSIQKSHSEGVPVMEPVMRFLALHGLKAQSSVLHKNTHSTAQTLVAKATELKSDLLVMGAYSHNRLKQAVMGGVTTYMLEHTPFPVLMAH